MNACKEKKLKSRKSSRLREMSGRASMHPVVKETLILALQESPIRVQLNRIVELVQLEQQPMKTLWAKIRLTLPNSCVRMKNSEMRSLNLRTRTTFCASSRKSTSQPRKCSATVVVAALSRLLLKGTCWTAGTWTACKKVRRSIKTRSKWWSRRLKWTTLDSSSSFCLTAAFLGTLKSNWKRFSTWSNNCSKPTLIWAVLLAAETSASLWWPWTQGHSIRRLGLN